jgi:hypothetical protein
MMNRLICAVVGALVLAGCGAQAARVCEMFSDEGGARCPRAARPSRT